MTVNQTLKIILFFLISSTSPFAVTHIIEFGGTIGNNYAPSNLTVNVGDTIEWRGDFSAHPLSSTGVPSGASNFSNSTGTSYQYVVSATGDYNYRCDFHFLAGMTGTFTAVAITDVNDPLKPDAYNLEQNYPNPFNPVTTIRYSIQEEGFVSLKVYDILGNLVSTLINEEKLAGIYEVKFNGSGFESGIYFYQIKSGDFSDTKRFVLLK